MDYLKSPQQRAFDGSDLAAMYAGNIASCCQPGGACFEAGLDDVQHKAEPPPAVIYVRFSDGGGNIRKWSAEPFDGAQEYRLA